MRKTPLPFGPTVANEGFAPLCGAGATSSGSSKDPSRPLGGEKMRLIGLIGLMGLMGLVGSCTSDLVQSVAAPEQEQQELEPEQGLPLDVMSYVTEYKDYVMTRTEPAWVPAGFTTAPEHKAIGVFFTKDASGGNPASNEERRFWYNDNGTPDNTVDDNWFISGKEMPQGDFYLYGFMPYNAADNVTVAPNTTYAEGATLSFNRLGSIMTKDICVLIGAKEGSSPTDPTTYEEVTIADGESVAGLYEKESETFNPTTDLTAQSGKTYYERKDLKIGQFATKMKASQNKLFMLFEHIYAKVDFCFRVDAEYAKLRTIKLKELTLMAYTYTKGDLSDLVEMKKYGFISVELKANTTGASPIVNKIVFNLDNNSGDMDPVLLFEGEETLPSSADKYPADYEVEELRGKDKYTERTGFVPYFNFTADNTKVLYVLRSTYDVYDNNRSTEHPNGNLIRLNQQAENMIVPYNLFNTSELEVGKRYTIHLTVKPTYLYVMSEEDIDNPTVVLN